jgi:hypothetical protein
MAVQDMILKLIFNDDGTFKGLEQINTELKKVDDSTNKADDSVNELNQSFKKTTKTTEDISKNLQKAGESGSKGFKAIGLAIKGAGIGLAISAIALIKDVFSANQKVVDLFSTALGTMSDMIRDFFSFVSENAGTIVDWFKQIFDDPVQAIKDFGQAILDNLIERFNSFLETLGYVGKAISELFKGNFDAAWNEAMKAAEESVDILTGVDNTVEKVTEAVTEAADAFGNYAKSTWNANAALVALQNNAKLAAAQQARLAEQYDREAELLRQTRDDERNSINDRIKANNDLLAVLDKQEKAELAAANAQVEAAAATYNHSKTIENQTALIQAQAQADGVRAKVAGFRSEQQMNDLALSKELNDMLKSQNESIADLSVSEQKFQAERNKNEIKRLTDLKSVLEQEKILQLERLQNEINKHKEGTQARIDAQIAYNQKKLELDQALYSNEDALREAKLNRDKEFATISANVTLFNRDREFALLEIEYAEKLRLYKDDKDMAELLEKEKQEKIRQIRMQGIQSNFEMASLALDALSSLNEASIKGDEASQRKAFERNKNIQKAQATIAMAAGIVQQLAVPQDQLKGINFVKAAALAAAGIANIVKINQTQFNGNAPSPNGGNLNTPTGGANAPAVDFSGVNMLNNAPGTVETYVLAGNVANALEARQKIIDQSHL